MFTVTKRFEFDAAHRLLNHEGQCKYLHGHRYIAEVTVEAKELDSLGRVIDFSVIKDRIGSWIKRRWDHNILLNSEDSLAEVITANNHGKDPYFIFGKSPTAEVMALHLFEQSIDLLGNYDIKVKNVRIYETPTSFSDFDGVEK